MKSYSQAPFSQDYWYTASAMQPGASVPVASAAPASTGCQTLITIAGGLKRKCD